jgi:hypothetical protein
VRYLKSFLFGIALSVIAAKLFQVLTILYFVYRPHTTPVAMVPVSTVNNDGPSFDLTTHHYGSASMVMTVGYWPSRQASTGCSEGTRRIQPESFT